jgi:hypothetical protein
MYTVDVLTGPPGRHDRASLMRAPLALRFYGDAGSPELPAERRPAMPPIHVMSTQDSISGKALRGDGAVLLAFNLDEHLVHELAGFAIKCEPARPPVF